MKIIDVKSRKGSKGGIANILSRKLRGRQALSPGADPVDTCFMVGENS